MKKILLAMLGCCLGFAVSAQSTFGPRNTSNNNGAATGRIDPATYYSPVTSDPSTPPWGCSQYRDSRGVVSPPYDGANAVSGYGGMTGWNSSDYKAYTYQAPGYQGHANFRILFPPGYDPNNTSKKYPLIIFLHGKGEAGRLNYLNDCDVRTDDNDHQLVWGGQPHRDIVTNDPRYQAIVLFPQNSYGSWANGTAYNSGYYNLPDAGTISQENKSNLEMIEFMIAGNTASDGQRFNVDPNRIYIEGLSAGGGGVWDCIIRRPDLFAGAIPMSSAGTINQANLLSYMGIWYWQGGIDDNPVPLNGGNALKAIQAASGFRRDASYTDISTGVNGSGTALNTYVGSARYIEESAYGHGVFTDCYSHPDFWRWLFSQNQLNIKAFADTALCSGSSVRIGVTPGLAGYDWQYSPDNITYTSALPGGLDNTTHDLTVSVLGYYRVRLNRNTTGWTNYSQPIKIISKAPAAAPVVTLDNSTILPSLSGNTVTLSAPAGMAAYNWSDGSASQTLATSTAGTYSVSVTPVNGCPSAFSASYTILTGQTPNASIASPTNLAVSTASATSLQLTWSDNANNETGYEIYRSTVSGNYYSFVGLINTPNITSFVDANLQSNTTYYYQVRAVKNGVGASGYTGETAGTTSADTAPPSAPSNLTATNVSTNTIALAWNSSSDNVGVTGYDVYQNGTYIASVGTSASPAYTATGLSVGTSYTYFIKARDAANNNSIASNSLTVSTYTLVSGVVNYSYYEGSFNNLNSPLFNGQAPLKTGYVAPVFSLSPASSTTLFGFKYDGIINIPTTGNWTFYTESDDGSNLFIDGTQVVFNDYNQGMTERNGTVSNLSAGNHSIQVTYRQGGGGYGLNVRWSGPGIAKQIIPDSYISGYSPGNVYYTKSSGNLTTTSTWGTIADGTGTAPANFSSANQTFYITRVATLSANWAVSGSSSKIIISSGGILTIPAGFTFTGQINLEGTGTLIIQNGSLFSTASLGNVASTATIRFATALNIPQTTYGNVILGNTGDNTAKTFTSGTVTILGNLTLASGSVTVNSGAALTLAGNLTLSAAISLPIDVQATGSSQTFTGNGFAISLKSLSLNAGTTVTLATTGGTSNLTTAANLTLSNLSTLNIQNNLLTINGLLNQFSQTGSISSNGGSLAINAAGSTSYLYLTAGANTLNNITVNITGGGSVSLRNTGFFTGILKLQAGNLNTTNGNLTLVSNASGTGRLAKVENGASLTGSLTVQRYFSNSDATTKGWFHIGNAVKGQKASDWAAKSTVWGPWIPGKYATIQRFREDTVSSYPSNNVKYYENSGWYGIQALSDAINPGAGVRMYLYNEFFSSRNATLENTGLPVIGDGNDNTNTTGEAFAFNLTYTPATGYGGGGWNLVSNPYPSDIDWTLPAWTKTNVATTVYIWDSKANNGKGQYTTYNTATSLGTNGGTGRIALGQAFFVKAITVGPVLKITEDAKTATSTALLKASNSIIENVLRIKLLNKAGDGDETVVFFQKQATTGFDENLDALKLYGGSLNVSSLTADGKDLAMNALPATGNRIKLNLKNNAIGSYSFNFSGVSTFGNLKVSLSDKFLNTLTDLSATPVYNFSTTSEAASAGSERFELVFGTGEPTPDLINSRFILEQNIPNPFDIETLINFNVPEAGVVTLTIYSNLGIRLDEMTLNAVAGKNTLTWNPQQRIGKRPDNGIYYYKLRYGSQTLTRRMMIVR